MIFLTIKYSILYTKYLIYVFINGKMMSWRRDLVLVNNIIILHGMLSAHVQHLLCCYSP